jgi:glycosyltransferase involved in cell wall biosynthesis
MANPPPVPPAGVRVLLTSTRATSFVLQDVELLRSFCTVDHLNGSGPRAAAEIVRRSGTADVLFAWFASAYAAVAVASARFRRKPSLVVVGGVDVARYPEIGYGLWLSRWRSVLSRYAIRNATRVLAVDPHQQREAARLAEYDGGNIMYLPTGYDALRWSPSGPKEPTVLTVAGSHDRSQMKVKGIDLLFDAARLLPDVRFVVAGIWEGLLPHARSLAPGNLELLPFLPQDDLLGLYRRAAVYCQPSYTEGLPNSLCEAMLCGCVPVGTDAGGIPTAIGDRGWIVPYGDPPALAAALRQALAAPPEAGDRARERIAAEFTLERRRSGLMRIIAEVTA